jgi:hypothetical protein
MSKIYVAASLWGHAIGEAKQGKPCCLDAETILTTNEQITRLRALVEELKEVLEIALDEVPYSDTWDATREQVKAALEKE